MASRGRLAAMNSSIKIYFVASILTLKDQSHWSFLVPGDGRQPSAPRQTPFTSDIPSALLDPNWQPRFGFTYSICLITWLETPLCQHRPPPALWQSWCLICPVLTSRCGFPSLLAQGLCQQYSDCDSWSEEVVFLQRD